MPFCQSLSFTLNLKLDSMIAVGLNLSRASRKMPQPSWTVCTSNHEFRHSSGELRSKPDPDSVDQVQPCVPEPYKPKSMNPKHPKTKAA